MCNLLYIKTLENSLKSFYSHLIVYNDEISADSELSVTVAFYATIPKCPQNVFTTGNRFPHSFVP